jgi:hypothetical protein
MLLIELCSVHCWRLSSYIPDSVVDPDPDSMGFMDPDPDSQSGSGYGSRRAKITSKLINIIFRSAECSFLTAEGFSWSLDVL